LSLLVCVTGCQSQKSPTQTKRAISTETSCLKQYQVSEPNRALQACNDTIAATPDQPELLRDRAFIHTLNGRHQKACADIAAGLKLIRESTAPVDPMLKHELEVRQATCKHARTIAGND
jgi:regulator of sirC expression with transglutaminase-like and TPR domain